MASDVQTAIFARRLKLYPSPEQARVLDSQSRICCWLFNQLKGVADELRVKYVEAVRQSTTLQPPALNTEGSCDASSTDSGAKESCEAASEIARTLYSKRGLRNLVPGLKDEHPFLKSVHSSPLKNAALRLSQAIGAYQASKKGKRPGPEVAWPRFHKWRADWFSLEYDEPKKGFRFEEGVLHLSLGANERGERLNLSLLHAESTPVLSSARNLRIVKEGRTYWAVVTLERAMAPVKDVQNVVALDPNHKNFAYGFDNRGNAFEVANFSTLRLQDARIDALKGQRDRLKRKSQQVEVHHANGQITRYWRPSRRWQKIDDALKRAEEKRREQTKHFLFSLANKLSRQYDLIGIGDYAPQPGSSGLGKKANRQIHNRSLIGRFKPVLLWVAKRSGKQAVVYDETGTTRTCFDCNHVVEGGIAPHIRAWKCTACGSEHHRDENAAKNGLARIYEASRARAGNLTLPRSGPVFGRWNWLFQPSGWYEVPSGEANMNQNRRPEPTGRLSGNSQELLGAA